LFPLHKLIFRFLPTTRSETKLSLTRTDARVFLIKETYSDLHEHNEIEGGTWNRFPGHPDDLKPALVEPRSKSTRTTYETPGDSAGRNQSTNQVRALAAPRVTLSTMFLNSPRPSYACCGQRGSPQSAKRPSSPQKRRPRTIPGMFANTILLSRTFKKLP